MVIPAGFAQVNFIHTGTSVPSGAEWTLGIALPSTAIDPADVAEDIAAIWIASGLRGLMTAGVLLNRILVKFGPDATGPSAEEVVVLSGNITSPGIQPGTALLVKKMTLIGGRAGRGRLYFPGLPEADVEANGSIGGPYLAAAQTAFEAFRVAMNTALLTPVVLHSAASPLSTPTPITQFSVQGVAATQRRRLRR